MSTPDDHIDISEAFIRTTMKTGLTASVNYRPSKNGNNSSTITLLGNISEGDLPPNFMNVLIPYGTTIDVDGEIFTIEQAEPYDKQGLVIIPKGTIYTRDSIKEYKVLIPRYFYLEYGAEVLIPRDIVLYQDEKNATFNSDVTGKII